jgi:hypothetical protein
LLTLVAGAASAVAQSETLSADTSRPNNSTFVLGEAVRVTFTASGLPSYRTTPLSVKVSDEFGTAISSTSIQMAADGSGNASTNFAAPAAKFGYYRVDAALPDGIALSGLGTRPAGFLSYAVVTDPVKRVNYGDERSHFGMQGGFSDAQGSVIPYLGIRYVLGGPAWGEFEPKYAGQFAAARSAAASKRQIFPKYPVTDAAAAYNGVPWPTYEIALVTKAEVPAWALLPGTSGTVCKKMGALNSSGIDALPGFARALAEHFNADFPGQSAHYYQVTWEPAKWCFAGTPQQLVQFYQLTYASIHRADPKAVVMGPTLFPHNVELMRDLWAAGLADYLDAVSMHPYVDWPPETHNLIDNIRTQMQMARNAKGRSVPFVGTEEGYVSASIGELNQALGDIRSTIILLGEGFQFDFAFYSADFWSLNFTDKKNYYGYYWNLNPKISWGTDKIGPKPAVPAYAAMTSLLDGSNAVGPVANLIGTQLGYRFQRNGTTILALWDYQTTSAANLPVPNAGFQVCNWMGNCTAATGSGGSINLTLSGAPTYLVGRGL